MTGDDPARRLGVGRIVLFLVRRDGVGVRVGRRWRGWRESVLLLQHRPKLLDGLVQGPQLRQQRQIQLSQAVHFSPEDGQLGVQCGGLPGAAAGAAAVRRHRDAVGTADGADRRLAALGHERRHADAL